MKRALVFLICLSFFTLRSFGGVLVFEGNYQGKNLYVQNPFTKAGVGFCAYEVLVNDKVTTDETNSSAFEIDLSVHDLEIGEKITVKVKYTDDCTPKVLNPEVLKPKSTFETIDIKVTDDRILKWTTKGETGELPYIIEQKRWNKWVRVGEVQGKGTPEKHEYSFKIQPHSGENIFRVKQVDYTGRPRVSPTAKYRDPSMKELTFSPKKVSDKIMISGETLYEIYDQYGNIVKKGFDDTINVENLDKGLYYLNFDNKYKEFVKK
ncbi:MAG: hypothetical protein ABEH43_09670 [Flavobacteriales bacterium]